MRLLGSSSIQFEAQTDFLLRLFSVYYVMTGVQNNKRLTTIERLFLILKEVILKYHASLLLTKFTRKNQPFHWLGENKAIRVSRQYPLLPLMRALMHEVCARHRDSATITRRVFLCACSRIRPKIKML